MSVEYRPIAGFPGYRVGDDGSVWSQWTISCKPILRECWRQLSLCKEKGGYLAVRLSKLEQANGKRIGRKFWVAHIVLEAFVGPGAAGMESCHDPDPSPMNNALTNLRWDSSKGNKADMVRLGRSTKGSKCSLAKLNEAAAAGILRRLASGESQKSIATDLAVHPSTISYIYRRKTWNHVQKELSY